MAVSQPPAEELAPGDDRFLRVPDAPEVPESPDALAPADELAEVQRLRRRLMRDLEALGERVERLSAPAPAPPSTPDLAAVIEKLASVQRHLDEARAARRAVVDAQVVRAHEDAFA